MQLSPQAAPHPASTIKLASVHVESLDWIQTKLAISNDSLFLLQNTLTSFSQIPCPSGAEQHFIEIDGLQWEGRDRKFHSAFGKFSLDPSH